MTWSITTPEGEWGPFPWDAPFDHAYTPKYAGMKGNPIPPGCRLCDRPEEDHPVVDR